MSQYYSKSADGIESGPGVGMNGTEPVNGVFEIPSNANGVNGIELAQALEEIEKKKKAWYAYFLTRDFWIVLALG